MPPAPDHNRPFHVWVIDDDPDCRMLLRDAIDLTGRGWTVSEIAGGLDAVAKFRMAADNPEMRPDVVLLDVNMPGQSGLEILRSVKSDAALADIPIVMLTATTDPGVEEEARRLGAHDYCPKPMWPETFQEKVVPTVQRCLPARRAQFDQSKWRTAKRDH